MKTKVFLDGNKRASVIFANHYLIAHGIGFLVIPDKEVPTFKKLLVDFYEGKDMAVICDFMKERWWFIGWWSDRRIGRNFNFSF